MGDGEVYKEEGGKRMPIDELFIVYNLKVKVQGMASWIMPCRFERFEEYHKNIADFAISSRIPPLPHDGFFSKMPKGSSLKKYIPGNFGKLTAAEKRLAPNIVDNPHVNGKRLALQDYVQEILSFPNMLHVGYTRKFLGLNDPNHLVGSEQKLEHA